jgi:hypothetical protein
VLRSRRNEFFVNLLNQTVEIVVIIIIKVFSVPWRKFRCIFTIFLLNVNPRRIELSPSFLCVYWMTFKYDRKSRLLNQCGNQHIIVYRIRVSICAKIYFLPTEIYLVGWIVISILTMNNVYFYRLPQHVFIYFSVIEPCGWLARLETVLFIFWTDWLCFDFFSSLFG